MPPLQITFVGFVIWFCLARNNKRESFAPYANITVVEGDDAPLVASQEPADGAQITDRRPTITLWLKEDNQIDLEKVRVFVDGKAVTEQAEVLSDHAKEDLAICRYICRYMSF